MASEIKQRTVYLLKRTDKPDDGTDIYVGSTSQPLRRRLKNHGVYSWLDNKNKLHKRMSEVGKYNWKMISLLTHACDKKTILEFENAWIKILNTDLNTISPLNENRNDSNIESARLKRHYCNSIESKRYHCNICNKSFGKLYNLRRHCNSLKHQYAYLNSID